MKNNNDEIDKKNEEKLNNLNNKNIVKAIPEKKHFDIFSFSGIIDEKLKEKITRRMLKLSSSRQSKHFTINMEQIEQKARNLITLEPFFF